MLSAVSALAQTPQRPAPMPTLPLTQLDDRILASDLDNRTFTLTFAQPVPVRDLLLLLVRGTSLSVVPDPSANGTFIGELKNVTVRQALGLILRPLGLDYALDGGVIRVFRREAETRLFDLNYIAIERAGAGDGRRRRRTRTSASVTTTTRTDVFEELGAGVRSLLTEHATFNIDRKAGLLQVTDFPERLDRVSRLSRRGAGPRPSPGADRRAGHRGRADRRQCRRHRLGRRRREDERRGDRRHAGDAADDERAARHRRRASCSPSSPNRAR